MCRTVAQRINTLLLPLAVLLGVQLAGCGSPETRARQYYEDGEKLLASHEDAKAAIEFRNALKLKQDLLPAWRGLAKAEEDLHQSGALASTLQSILDLDPKDGATRIKLARLLLSAGQPAGALKLLNAATAPSTNDATLLAVKAMIYLRLRDSTNSLQNAQNALKIDPNNIDALFVLAANRFENSDPNGALQLLSKAPQAQDNDLGTQLFKLRIYDQLKDYGHLESLLKTLAKRYPKNTAFQTQLVRLYMLQHHPDDAEKELRNIVATEPQNAQAGLALIRFLYTVRSPEAAKNELLARIKAGGDVFPYQLALAEFDFDQDHADDSFKLLNSLIKSSSSTDSTRAKLLMAELRFRKKDLDAALQIVDDVLSSDQRNVDALKLRALIRLDRTQVDAAISDLREALNDQPRSANLMLLLATAYERNGKIDLADKEFADAMKASNFNPSLGLDYVAFLQRHGGGDRAYDMVAELASRWPNNAQVLSVFAQMKLSRRDWSGAEQLADRIKHINDKSEVPDLIRGEALIGERQYDASIAAFQRAVADAPSAAQPMAALISAMLAAKQGDKAVAYLQSVLKQNPKNAEAYLLLGNIDVTNNKEDPAEIEFKSAIQAQPTAGGGYRALALLYIRQKRFPAALDIIKAGLKRAPTDAGLELSLAGIFELMHNYDGAISEYQELLKQQPDSLVAINNLASLLADHRTDKESLKQAQALVGRLQGAQIAQFKDTIGWVYDRSGDNKAALPLLEEAKASLPDSALVRYHLGMTLIDAGQPDKAAAELKDALQRTADNDLQSTIKIALRKIGQSP